MMGKNGGLFAGILSLKIRFVSENEKAGINKI